jgi:hypothetical protein
MIDGVEHAGETMVVAPGITEGGAKRILGRRQGATENAAVSEALLEDFVGRGLDAGRPTPFVLDGSKALLAAVTRTWGTGAVIQRCQEHMQSRDERRLGCSRRAAVPGRAPGQTSSSHWRIRRSIASLALRKASSRFTSPPGAEAGSANGHLKTRNAPG